MSVVSWGFLTNNAWVLLCVARDAGVRLRDIASSLGITERSAHGFVTESHRSRVRGEAERRAPQTLSDPGPHAVAGASQPGTCDRRSPRSPWLSSPAGPDQVSHAMTVWVVDCQAGL
jgi:hypothetical protein